MTESICRQTVERRQPNSPLSTMYYAECGYPAKYRIHYNRNYNRRADKVEMTSKEVCKRHLNMYKYNFDRLGVSYTVEKI